MQIYENLFHTAKILVDIFLFFFVNIFFEKTLFYKPLKMN